MVAGSPVHAQLMQRRTSKPVHMLAHHHTNPVRAPVVHRGVAAPPRLVACVSSTDNMPEAAITAQLEATARGFGAVYRNMDYTGGYFRTHNDAHMSVGVIGIDITQPCSTCCMCLCRPAEMQ